MALGNAIASLFVKIGSDISGLEKGLSQATQQVQGFDKRLRNIGGGMTKIGAVMTAGVTAPVIAGFVSMGKAASDFEAEMRNVQSISKITDQEMAALSDDFLNLSMDISKTTDTASNLASAYYDIQGSGFAGADGMTILEVSTKAATAGLTDTEVAARAIMATLNAYGKDASEAAHVSDVLFRTMDIGVISFEELASNIGDVVGTSSIAKVSIEEVGAAYATMTKGGINAAEATTALNQLLLSFVKPSTSAMDAAAEYGIELNAATLANKGLYGAMAEVIEKTGGSSDALAKIFPNVRAFKAAVSLAREDMGPFAQDMDAIGASAGATAAAFAIQTQSFESQMKNFNNTLQVLKIQLGSEIMPIVNEFLQNTIVPLIKAFIALPKPVKKMIVVGLGLAAALGPVLIVAGQMVSAIGAIIGVIGKLKAVFGILGALKGLIAGLLTLNPVVLAIVGVIGALYLAFKTNFLGIRDVVTEVWGAIQESFGYVKAIVSAFFKFLKGEYEWDRVQAVWRGATKRIGEIMGEAFGNIGQLFAKGFAAAVAGLKNAATTMVAGVLGVSMAEAEEIITRAWTNIKNFFGAVWDYIVQAATNAVALLKGVLVAAIQALAGDWAGAWETLKAAVGSFVGDTLANVFGFIERIGPAIAEKLAEAGQKIGDFFRGIGEWLGKARAWVGEALGAVGDFFAGLWNRISGLWGSITGKGKEKEAKESAGGIKGAWESIKTGAGVFAEIAGIIAQAWLDIATATASTTGQILADVIGWYGAMRSASSERNAAMLLDAQTTWAAMKATVATASMEMMQTAITTTMAMRMMVGAELTGMTDDAYVAGQGLATRFGDGIRGKLDQVRAETQAMVAEIRNLLPGSDAKKGPLSDIFASGRALPATLAKGIAAGTNHVAPAVDRLTGALASGYSGGAPRIPQSQPSATLEVAPAAGNSQSIVVTVNNPNPQAAEASIVRQLRNLSSVGVLNPI